MSLVPTDRIEVDGVVRFTGRIASPVDHKDVPYALVAQSDVTVPDAYSVLDEVDLPVEDQGNHPACVGWTFGAIKTFQEFRECGQVHRFDGLAVYQNAGGGPDGITMRAGAEATRDIGAPLQSDSARLYKIQAYAGVSPKVHDAVKHAIFTNGVVAGAFMVPRFFMGTTGGKEFDVAPGGGAEDIVGGHAIAVVGYNPEGVFLHNSWGTDWMDGGRAFVTWQFWDKYFDELWTTIDLRDNLVAQRFFRFRRGIIA